MGEGPKKGRRKERWIALSVSTLVGLILVEIALRMSYTRLPSIAGFEGTEYRMERLVDLAGEADVSLCHEVRTFLSHRSRWGDPQKPSGVHFAALDNLKLERDGTVINRGSRGGETQRFWVAGDSLAYGLGVRTGQTFGLQLADRIAVETGGGVEFRNLAVPGAGYCTAVQRVVGALQGNTPDVVLLVLSADDLEERLMLNVQGNLVALPDLAQSPMVRWAVHRSYFANLIWFRAVSVSEAVSGAQGRFVGRSTKATFQHAMAGLDERVQARGGTLLVAIVEPPGMPMCVDGLARQRCGWLKQDMDTMAGLLAEAGVHTVDTRGMWTGSEDDIVDRERSVVRSGGLAMHPSAQGHRQVADALWPDLAEAL